MKFTPKKLRNLIIKNDKVTKKLTFTLKMQCNEIQSIVGKPVKYIGKRFNLGLNYQSKHQTTERKSYQICVVNLIKESWSDGCDLSSLDNNSGQY